MYTPYDPSTAPEWANRIAKELQSGRRQPPVAPETLYRRVLDSVAARIVAKFALMTGDHLFYLNPSIRFTVWEKGILVLKDGRPLGCVGARQPDNADQATIQEAYELVERSLRGIAAGAAARQTGRANSHFTERAEAAQRLAADLGL